jgi:hypothetical protein
MSTPKRLGLQLLAVTPFGISLSVCGIEGWKLWLLILTSYISAKLFISLEERGRSDR